MEMATNSYSAAGQALGFGSTNLGIGMSVPGAGLGDQLRNQVSEETDEEKLRRKLGLSVTQSGAPGISPAGKSLFGGMV
jgi:hypothetical protein